MAPSDDNRIVIITVTWNWDNVSYAKGCGYIETCTGSSHAPYDAMAVAALKQLLQRFRRFNASVNAGKYN